MKAILISFDSIISLFILSLLLITILSLDYKIESSPSPHQFFALHTLSSLEKSGFFSEALEKPHKLRQFVNHLPKKLCATAKIVALDGTVIREESKCKKEKSNQIFYRSFIHNGTLYLFLLEVGK